MSKRKYTVEATTRTLARFLKVIDDNSAIADTLVNRVSTNGTEEYHYVVLTAPEEVHTALRRARYQSVAVK